MNLNDITWEEPRPAGDPTKHGFDLELYGVTPIPFWPGDLPVLWEIGWPERDMQEMKRLSRRWLYIAPPTETDLAA